MRGEGQPDEIEHPTTLETHYLFINTSDEYTRSTSSRPVRCEAKYSIKLYAAQQAWILFDRNKSAMHALRKISIGSGRQARNLHTILYPSAT
jgi:hypothetical protein